MTREADHIRRARERARQSCDGRDGAPAEALAAPAESFRDSIPPSKEKARGEWNFPAPIRASALRPFDASKLWLWEGLIARGSLTLFSAQCKAGKTTLVAGLLKALEMKGAFCGLDTGAARVLYVTEESEGKWHERKERWALSDHVAFLVRPFGVKPTFPAWLGFLAYLAELQKREAADLIVFDTLSNLWPVRDENSACEVQAALMPLHRLAGENTGLQLVHHLSKGDGDEAKGARGSGALAAFVDVILELRRFNKADRHDRRRVLTGYSRFEETPAELVVELSREGDRYTAHGDRLSVGRAGRERTILAILPDAPPGLTLEEIQEQWPDEDRPAKRTLSNELPAGVDGGKWQRAGAGKKGDPYRYWARPG